MQQKLRQALAQVYQTDQPNINYSSLVQVKLLNGIINETLRMKSSVPIGGPRITPPEGLQLGNVWIPGNVNIFTPPHVMHQSKHLYIAEKTTPEEQYLVNGQNELT